MLDVLIYVNIMEIVICCMKVSSSVVPGVWEGEKGRREREAIMTSRAKEAERDTVGETDTGGAWPCSDE